MRGGRFTERGTSERGAGQAAAAHEVSIIPLGAVCEFPPSRARPLGCLTETASEPYVTACPPRVLDARGAGLRP